MHSHNHQCPNCFQDLESNDSLETERIYLDFKCANKECNIEKVICNGTLAQNVMEIEDLVVQINNLSESVNDLFSNYKYVELEEATQENIDSRLNEIRDLLDTVAKEDMGNEEQRIELETRYEELYHQHLSFSQRENDTRTKHINGHELEYEDILVYTVVDNSDAGFSLVYCARPGAI